MRIENTKTSELSVWFTIDTNRRETKLTSTKLQSYEEFVDMIASLHENNIDFNPSRTFDFVAELSSGVVDNSMGGFLLHYIQADFSTYEGFRKFIDTWGISGLAGIDSSINISSITPQQHFTSDEVTKLYTTWYEYTHQKLLDAQKDFISVIDYCIDDQNQTKTVYLKPLQRYYQGLLNHTIPSIEKYSSNLRVTFDINPNYLSYNLESIDNLDNTLVLEALESADKINPTYVGDDFRTFVYLEFFYLIDELLLKKCSICGAYFIAKNKTNEIYCENCRNVSYSEKVKKDPLQKIYHTAYKTRHREKQKRIKENPDNKAWVDQWENLMKKWVGHSKKQVELARKRSIDEEQLKESLSVTLAELGGI